MSIGMISMKNLFDTDKHKEITIMSTATVDTPKTSTTTWNVDAAHSAAEFKVKHMMISNVKGRFSKLSGTLSLDEAGHQNSRVDVTGEAASIQTGDEQRDTHLK